MNRAILVLCVLGAASCTLCSCRSVLTSDGQLGGHHIRIIESRLGQAYGGGEARTMPDGKQAYMYAGGKLKLRLEDDVLTVNGQKYVLRNKNDSITVRDGLVEINSQPAQPADE
jgi:hypothetical protein